MQNEKKIEQRLKRKVKELGGLCLKWVSPGMTGVPDRLVFLPQQIYLVELKDPKGELSPRQKLVISLLDQLGIKVHVLCSDLMVDDFIKEIKCNSKM